MSKDIRDDAKVCIRLYSGMHGDCVRQARRVLLLFKAYRYQRAAWWLAQHEFLATGEISEFSIQSDKYAAKAAALMRQAEEV